MGTHKDSLIFFRLKSSILKTIESFNSFYSNTGNDFLFESFIGNLYNLLHVVRSLIFFIGASDDYSSLIKILDERVKIPEHLAYRFSFSGTYYELFRISRNMDGHIDKINKNETLLISKSLPQKIYIEILELVIKIYNSRADRLSGEEKNSIITSSLYIDQFLDPYRKLIIDSNALNILGGDRYIQLKQVLEFKPDENNVSTKD